ncbi:MAG TPA: OmpH family outer membrane protein [Acidobacteriaceae bacterium]
MNTKSSLLAAFVAGLLPIAAIAQAPAAPAAPAAIPAEAKLPPPSAFPAKIALVNFIGAVEETNEGQKVAMDLQKKYQPQKDKLEALAADVDSLKKQLQAAPASTTDEERNRRLKEIDTKDKQLQRDSDDASNSYQADMNEGLQKIAAKVHDTMVNYVAKNGYTLLFDYGGQQSPLIWAAQDQNADITQAVIEAYNASSGVAAPPPAAPATGTGGAHRPAASGTGRSTTAPRTTTPAK